MQIRDVLLNNIGDVVELRKLVPVVVLKHALGTHQLVTVSTKVFYLALLVHVAVHPRVVGDFSVCRLSGHDHILRPNRAHFNFGSLGILLRANKLLVVKQLQGLQYFDVRLNLLDGAVLLASSTLSSVGVGKQSHVDAVFAVSVAAVTQDQGNARA